MPQIPTTAAHLALVASRTGKNLSLDEVGAVIDAINALGAADDTLASTGNTADHQAGWFAGIDHERAEARESAGVGAQQLQERADKVVIANATGNPDLFQEAVKDLLAAVRMFRPAPAAGDARDAARWRFVRRKLCLTGNGDGTCAMQAINLPASIHGWSEPGSAVAEFCDAAIDAARAALASAPVDDAGNWQQYRLDADETAQQIIERERKAYADLLQSVTDKRRAGASAPVADEQGKPKMPASMRAGDCYPDFKVMPVGTAEIYAEVIEAWARRDERAKVSAPVAGEVVGEVLENGDTFRLSRKLPVGTRVYATPQASAENVRNAALEEAAQTAYKALFPTNDRSDWTEFAESAAYHAELATQCIRALKQPQAAVVDKSPNLQGSSVDKLAEMQGDKDGGQQRNWISDWSAAIKSLPMGREDAESIRSPSNACMHRNECRAMLDRQQRAGDADERAVLDGVRAALPEFRQQDDYLLAHGASLMSENSHEIIHFDTVRRIIRAALSATQPEQGERDEA